MSYMQTLDAFLDEVLSNLLWGDSQTENEAMRQEYFSAAKKLLKDKVNESYHNGQNAGPKAASAASKPAQEKARSKRPSLPPRRS
jgi:hypothetical protein